MSGETIGPETSATRPRPNAPSLATAVLITIDTEFSAGGDGAAGLKAPVTDQAVFCYIDGQSHGLEFLLRSFAEFGIKATFFVEAAHTLLIGPEPMRAAVAAILAAGHDVELHLHPMWLAAAAGEKAPLNDSMAALDEAQCRYLYETGLAAFAAWGAPAPIAFRAGNLQMGRAAYRALKPYGMALSSSIGIAIHAPPEPLLQIENGRRMIDGILEIPVLTFADLTLGARRHLHNLTITGAGAAETRAMLRQARASGLEEVILLTHPFEFIKKFDDRYQDLAPNRVNQRRLHGLCRWLAAQRDAFETTTFRERAPLWQKIGETTPQSLASPLPASLWRIIENKANDRFRWI